MKQGQWVVDSNIKYVCFYTFLCVCAENVSLLLCTGFFFFKGDDVSVKSVYMCAYNTRNTNKIQKFVVDNVCSVVI